MISFTKAHACGNDFLIVTEEAAHGHNWADLTRRLCARNTGVGADGIEFFAWTGPKSGRIRLHNADGSIAEISGNGTRCVAAWMARERNLQPGDDLEIATDAGLRVCHMNGVNTDGEFTVEVTTGMGVPTFAPRTVKLASGMKHCGRRSLHRQSALRHRGGHRRVRRRRTRRGTRSARRSARIRIFPTRPMWSLCASSTSARLRFASSSAALDQPHPRAPAARPRPRRRSRSNGCVSPLTVVAPGGAQTVAWDGPGTELWLTGPATLIARGEAW